VAKEKVLRDQRGPRCCEPEDDGQDLARKDHEPSSLTMTRAVKLRQGRTWTWLPTFVSTDVILAANSRSRRRAGRGRLAVLDPELLQCHPRPSQRPVDPREVDRHATGPLAPPDQPEQQGSTAPSFSSRACSHVSPASWARRR
jgi:hypothetical protein